MKKRLDTQTTYKGNLNEPATKRLEIPELDPLPNAPLDPAKHLQTIDREVYQPDESLIQAVNLAIALGRPLLLQGEPGCGKTRLAYALAYELGRPLEECFIKSTSRAQDLLYSYDAINRLYDSQRKDPRSKDLKKYIKLGPLGRAIARAQLGRPSVVLIDEIDKADLDFANDLLLELDRLEFRIPETGQSFKVDPHRPELRPIVLVTNNEEKVLPTAFLRRCIFHFLEFPSSKAELEQILELHDIKDGPLSHKAIEVILELRKIDGLTKKPGLSELLDWVGYLQAVNTDYEELDKLPYLGALIKRKIDQDKVLKQRPHPARG